ncbi:DegV family protein [Mordavella massiliensis]|nr:DegV family protein [Mordavella massiliensis]
MKPKFAIVSDGSCDLPAEEAARHDIEVVHFLVSFDGERYAREGVDISLSEFYQQMHDHPRQYPKTAAPSPEDFLRAFESAARKSPFILCICISTKLSSSMQSALIARDMMAESHPDLTIEVVDSLCATLMQSVYVLETCRLRDAGFSLEEATEEMEKLRKTARILFTVGDLDYIQHGGRIGKMTGFAGNLLNIKPLITLEDGEIHSSGIRRGRKKSLDGLTDLLCNYLESLQLTPKDCSMILGYSYDEEEALQFADRTALALEEKYGSPVAIPSCRIGATIGVHAGPTAIGFGIIQRADKSLQKKI